MLKIDNKHGTDILQLRLSERMAHIASFVNSIRKRPTGSKHDPVGLFAFRPTQQVSNILKFQHIQGVGNDKKIEKQVKRRIASALR